MRNLYTGIFLGISLFAILGLALGPTMQTATAHETGKLVGHKSGPLGATPHLASTDHDGCGLVFGEIGAIHFLDMNGDGIHNHDSSKPSERTLCLRSR